MGVKKQHRLVLLLVCLILIGVTVYPHIPALVKTAQAVQGELKFGSTMDQVMTVINKTYYSADVWFGNGAGGFLGVLQGTGNVGIGMGTNQTNARTPNQRLSVADTMAITAPSGIQYLLMGNQDSGGAGNPAIIRAANGDLEIGKGTAWIGPGGTFTSNVFFKNNGNVGIGSTAPTKKLDVVGDINFSGGLYQGGAAFTGSKWTNTTGGIYYNSGNVGVGTTAPGDGLAWQSPAFHIGGARPTLNLTTTTTGGFSTIRLKGPSTNSELHLNFLDGADTSMSFFSYQKPGGAGEVVTIKGTGNVGIGTTNPQKKLDIVAANSTINNTSGNLSIVPNANLLITQGNVGIGTTSPGTKLQVKGGGIQAIGAADNWSGIILNSTANNRPVVEFRVEDNSLRGKIEMNDINAGTGDRLGLFAYQIGNVNEVMSLRGNGNVGISSTTPGAKLDVGGTTSTIANVSGNLSIVPASNLVVTQGNVGIGSTSPTQKLDVVGNVTISGNVGIGTTGPTQLLQLQKINTDNYLKIDAGSTVANYSGIMLSEYNINYGWTLRHSAATDNLYISYQDNTPSFTDTVTFNRAGNVGIGSTAPRASLDLSSKTDGEIPPQGTTAQRPGTPVTGTMRYNTTLGRPEYYNGTAWIAIVSPSGPVLATGGEITEIGGYRIHTFRTTGTFTVSSNITADVLVVAGGGGGGAYSTTNANGGGGGGGVVYAVNQALTPAAYTVTIGRGGTGYTWNTNSCGANGSNSVFGALPAAIGGGGGAGQSSCAGGAGGSGGGCSQNTAAGASNQTGAGTNITVYGNAGGSGSYTWTGCGGGGAGSAGVGGNAVGNSYPSGNGGNGITLTISGSSVCYAGGGGGGGNSSERSGKGFCGGGRGFGSTNYGDATGDDYRNYPDSLDPVTGGSRDVHGISNTGGGGGGGSYWSPNVGHYHAGSGGSGIVIVRYAIP